MSISIKHLPILLKEIFDNTFNSNINIYLVINKLFLNINKYNIIH